MKIFTELTLFVHKNLPEEPLSYLQAFQLALLSCLFLKSKYKYICGSEIVSFL